MVRSERGWGGEELKTEVAEIPIPERLRAEGVKSGSDCGKIQYLYGVVTPVLVTIGKCPLAMKVEATAGVPPTVPLQSQPVAGNHHENGARLAVGQRAG